MGVKEQILDTAETLFSEHGIEAVSVREIQEKIGVNVAAVHYHFGSRKKLILAVMKRRIDPLNAARIHLLELLEARTPAQSSMQLEDVLRAFVTPVFELLETHPKAAWLLAHVHTSYDNSLRKFNFEQFIPLVLRFQPAFRRALPESRPDLDWAKMQCVWGSMIFMLVRKQRRDTLGEAAPPEPSITDLIETWVAFCAAGLRSGARH